MLQGPGGVGHQPVMGMDQVEIFLPAELDPFFQHGEVKLVHPGEKVQRPPVIGRHPVNLHSFILFPGGGMLVVSGDDLYFVPLLDQGPGDFRYMLGQSPITRGGYSQDSINMRMRYTP